MTEEDLDRIAPDEGAPDDREAFPYKMKDLCELTGLPRQAIHFYIQRGLLPPVRKTGRNMAWYGPQHVERLRLVRKLQHERFLPLEAIKALLDGREDRFSARQRKFLEDVKRELSGTLARDSDARRRMVDATRLAAESQVAVEEVARLEELGVLSAIVDDAGRVRVADDDLWILECFGRLRAAGFSAELGFCVDDLAVYVETIDGLLERDAELLSSRLGDLPPVVAARMIERAVPILHEFLVRYHASRVRDFFSTVQPSEEGGRDRS